MKSISTEKNDAITAEYAEREEVYKKSATPDFWEWHD